MILTATVLLILSSAVAAVDIIGLHLIRFKLYGREETFYEHQLHTAHAAAAIVAVFLLFCVNLGGRWLWAAVLVIGIWFGLEVLDLWCEKDSRKDLGGLPNFEYTLHIVISGMRFSFIALMLAAKPVDAWRWGAPMLIQPPHPAYVRWIGLATAAGGLLIVLLHLWLMLPRYRVVEGDGVAR